VTWKIGDEFRTAAGRWRITDIGSRVIVAIRIDEVKVGGTSAKTLTGEQADKAGWLDGPPYGVAEIVFDEDDQQAIEKA